MPRYMMKTAFDLVLQSVDALKFILPESGDKLVWQQFQNKLQAFHLFEHVDLVLGISPKMPLSLGEMITKASALGPFFSPWATEGLGHYYTQLLIAGNMSGRILGQDAIQSLPPESMVPLHAGMGLALAETVMARRQDSATTAEVFVQLCRDNASPQFLGATIEALGLVVRNLYPESTPSLSQHLWQTSQELFEYFWHGVGRGLYFAPANFLPYLSTPWQGYEMCLQEPPNDIARRNAVAGFTWAATLVNIRHPAILVSFLERHGERLAADDAFANGIFSALVIWLNCAPSDTSVANLLKYQLDGAGPNLRQLWETQIRSRAEAALQFRQGSVNGTGELFRHRPLASLRTFSGLR
ncbi:MAG TPA: hypothetical protein VI685_26770 [Candidatus Angelobacter sp.]